MIKTYLKSYWLQAVIATILTFVLAFVSTVLFSMIGPSLQLIVTPSSSTIGWSELVGSKLGSLVTYFMESESVLVGELLLVLPLLFIFISLSRAILMVSQWYIWESVSEKIAAQMREHIACNYLELDPVKKFKSLNQDQNLATIMTTDVRIAREYIVHFYGGLPRELVQVLFYLATLWVLSSYLFLIFVVGLLPALVVVKKLGKKIRSRSENALDFYTVLSEWLQQRFLGVETIKQLRMESYESSLLKELTQKLNSKYLRTVRVKVRTSPIIEIIAVLAMVIVLSLALGMVHSREVTGSVMISFFSILAILSQSASKLGRYFNSNKEGGAAVDRIDRLMSFLLSNNRTDLELKTKDQPSLVTVSNLAYRYKGSDVDVFSGLNFAIEKGKIYCITGPSGAGKSTLMLSLIGLLEPYAGEITYQKSLARHDIGYLPQAMQLPPTSIAHSISYPDPCQDKAEVEAALSLASVDELGFRLQDDSIVRSDQVSGGQLQRLFLARLFYKKFSIVFIDEGTSAIDPKNEANVYKSIKSLASSGTAVVMIAHRASAIALADEIISL